MAFAVVADEFEPFDFELLTDVFRTSLGMTAYDARHHARRARGVLAENVNATEAKAVEARLGGRGVRIVGQEWIPDLRRPRSVRRLRFEEGSLEVNLGFAEEFGRIPWRGIVLISSGVVHVEEQVVEDGLDTSSGVGEDEGPMRWRSNVRQEFRDDVVTDVIARVGDGPDFTHLRMNPHELVYSEILGERAAFDPDANARQAAFDNFRGVLAILGRRAKEADVTPQTVALVAEERSWVRPPAESRFEDETAFLAYNRWWLARHHAPGLDD